MEHLNVQGLPEPIVRGLEVIVEIARKLTGREPPQPRRQRIAFNVRKGTVYGKLTREEIYDDIPSSGDARYEHPLYAYSEDAPQ